MNAKQLIESLEAKISDPYTMFNRAESDELSDLLSTFPEIQQVQNISPTFNLHFKRNGCYFIISPGELRVSSRRDKGEYKTKVIEVKSLEHFITLLTSDLEI